MGLTFAGVLAEHSGAGRAHWCWQGTSGLRYTTPTDFPTRLRDTTYLRGPLVGNRVPHGSTWDDDDSESVVSRH